MGLAVGNAALEALSSLRGHNSCSGGRIAPSWYPSMGATLPISDCTLCPTGFMFTIKGGGGHDVVSRGRKSVLTGGGKFYT